MPRLMTTCFSFAVMMAVSATAASDELRLGVGDSAPALAVDQWLRGDKMEDLAPGRVYLIEFWATWCPYCIQAIPHLNEYQQKWPDDLTVISVAGSERQKTAEEKIAHLESFLGASADVVQYRIAFDDKALMVKNWMRAAQISTIPTAFIVDRAGVIAFVGNPRSPEFHQALEKIMAGTWDVDAVKKDLRESHLNEAAAQRLLKRLDHAIATKNWTQAKMLVLTGIGQFDPVYYGLKNLEVLGLMADAQFSLAAEDFSRTNWNSLSTLLAEMAVVFDVAKVGTARLDDSFAQQLNDRAFQLFSELEAGKALEIKADYEAAANLYQKWLSPVGVPVDAADECGKALNPKPNPDPNLNSEPGKPE